MAALNFQIDGKDPQSKARAGRITTDHGVIETPIFMPVGTAGTVKAVPQRDLSDDIRAQIILGNTICTSAPAPTCWRRLAGCTNSWIGSDRF